MMDLISRFRSEFGESKATPPRLLWRAGTLPPHTMSQWRLETLLLGQQHLHIEWKYCRKASIPKQCNFIQCVKQQYSSQ